MQAFKELKSCRKCHTQSKFVNWAVFKPQSVFDPDPLHYHHGLENGPVLSSGPASPPRPTKPFQDVSTHPQNLPTAPIPPTPPSAWVTYLGLCVPLLAWWTSALITSHLGVPKAKPYPVNICLHLTVQNCSYIIYFYFISQEAFSVHTSITNCASQGLFHFPNILCN